ncbi:MAG: hypothetical protein R3D83_02645 [Caenibius sp.]
MDDDLRARHAVQLDGFHRGLLALQVSTSVTGKVWPWMPIMLFFCGVSNTPSCSCSCSRPPLMMGGDFTIGDYFWVERNSVHCWCNLVGGITFTGLMLYSAFPHLAQARGCRLMLLSGRGRLDGLPLLPRLLW